VSNKLERFTQRARRVLSLAQEDAERLRHGYIGTEHLLLGLMREEGGVAGRVLRELGLEQKRVQEMIERLTGAPPARARRRPRRPTRTVCVLRLRLPASDPRRLAGRAWRPDCDEARLKDGSAQRRQPTRRAGISHGAPMPPRFRRLYEARQRHLLQPALLG